MSGGEVKEIIKNKGLKQQYVSKQIGVHFVTFNKFLNDKYSLQPDKLRKLRQVLDI